MKRYIEIVYDNSGSMVNRIAGKGEIKYKIAQELFEKDILPIIGKKGDTVVLRLLGYECGNFKSQSELLSDNGSATKAEMLKRIKRINHGGSTPLFYTVSDAIDACKQVKADKHLIFVLTDGDDTCQMAINELISQDVIDEYIKFYDVLLVQLGIENHISKNNLTAFTNYLGGQTISLNGGDTSASMRNKLKKALRLSGFSNKLPLEHCYDNQSGVELSWEEIENRGIAFHQALLLYNKAYLSWLPEYSTSVSSLQFSELQFIFGISFKTGLPDELIKSMLSQLKKPYYYSHDCIYWDFSSARWKYFVPQNHIEQMDNPKAKYDDNIGESNINEGLLNARETYNREDVYKVELTRNNNPKYTLKWLGKADWNFILKNGDQIKFYD